MSPYDDVIRALMTLISKSGQQLGQEIVLTEKNLSMTGQLMVRLDADSSSQLAARIRNEVPGAGTKFHTVTIKFPGIGAYPIPLDDPED